MSADPLKFNDEVLSESCEKALLIKDIAITDTISFCNIAVAF